MQLLDLGCGPGPVVDQTGREGARARVGIDHDGSQLEMLDQAGEVIRVNLRGVPGGRRQVGFSLSPNPKVRRDHIGQGGKA